MRTFIHLISVPLVIKKFIQSITKLIRGIDSTGNLLLKSIITKMTFEVIKKLPEKNKKSLQRSNLRSVPSSSLLQSVSSAQAQSQSADE